MIIRGLTNLIKDRVRVGFEAHVKLFVYSNFWLQLNSKQMLILGRT